MEDVIKEVYGNVADWQWLMGNTEGIVPMKIGTTGTALLPVIKAGVDKRRAKALIVGDVKELANLDKYYDSIKGSEYVVEEPIEKDGKYFACYMNRTKGFIYPDAPIELLEFGLRDIFELSGVDVYKPKTLKEFETYVSDHPDKVVLTDLIELGHDVIVLIAERHNGGQAIAMADTTGLPAMEVLDWTPVGFNSPTETFWTYASAAIRVKSKFITPNELVIPVITGHELAWLITPKVPQQYDTFKVVPQVNAISTYAIPTSGRNPLLAVPMAGPVLISVNDVPITKEQYDTISFDLFRFNLYSGKVTSTWLGNGLVQMAVELMETDRYYGGYRGRFETAVHAMVSININGKSHSQLIPMIDTIPDIPSQSYRAIMRSAVESTEFPGFLDVSIERQTLDPGQTTWKLSNFDIVRKLVCYDAGTLNNYGIDRSGGWHAVVKRVPNEPGIIRLLFNSYDPSFEGIEKYTVEITPIDLGGA